MKQTLKNLVIIFILTIITIPSFGWGGHAHSTIAFIAEKHLTPKAKKNLDKILDGKSIVYYASWLDYYRKEMLVEYTTEEGEVKKRDISHAIKIDNDGNVIIQKNREAISVINQSTENLKDYKNLDDSTRLASLQCIIHLVGDMHCPGHVRYADFDKNSVDKQYDNTKVLYNKKKINMHSVWDSRIINETTAGGVYDLAHLVDRVSKKEIKEIQEGTPEEWGKETADRSKNVWYIKDGETITKKYFLEQRDFAYEQIEKAGLRLAKVLNDLFN